MLNADNRLRVDHFGLCHFCADLTARQPVEVDRDAALDALLHLYRNDLSDKASEYLAVLYAALGAVYEPAR
jgi:hypothetical protein